MKRILKLLLLPLLSLVLQATGDLSNTVAIHSNGAMPVWIVNREVAEGMVGDYSHIPLDHNTRFKLLCDILPIPEYAVRGLQPDDNGWIWSVASIGDVLLFTGFLSFWPCVALIFVWPAWVWFRKPKLCSADLGSDIWSGQQARHNFYNSGNLGMLASLLGPMGSKPTGEEILIDSASLPQTEMETELK
jgi:hypothetical protein